MNALPTQVVGEAHAHVQGESLKACAAFLSEGFSTPRLRLGEDGMRCLQSAFMLLAAMATLGACSHKDKFADLGKCRLAAAEHPSAPDRADLIYSCMASKGYDVDASYQGCSSDPRAIVFIPGLSNPNPDDERCYAEHKKS